MFVYYHPLLCIIGRIYFQEEHYLTVSLCNFQVNVCHSYKPDMTGYTIHRIKVDL